MKLAHKTDSMKDTTIKRRKIKQTHHTTSNDVSPQEIKSSEKIYADQNDEIIEFDKENIPVVKENIPADIVKEELEAPSFNTEDLNYCMTNNDYNISESDIGNNSTYFSDYAQNGQGDPVEDSDEALVTIPKNEKDYDNEIEIQNDQYDDLNDEENDDLNHEQNDDYNPVEDFTCYDEAIPKTVEDYDDEIVIENDQNDDINDDHTDDYNYDDQNEYVNDDSQNHEEETKEHHIFQCKICQNSFYQQVNLQENENSENVLYRNCHGNYSMVPLHIKKNIDIFKKSSSESKFEHANDLKTLYEMEQNNTKIDNIEGDATNSIIANPTLEEGIFEESSQILPKLQMNLSTNVHEGHKEHKCSSCNKSFFKAYQLKNHIKAVHEGCKEYKCDSCGKSFSQVTSLNRHIHTIHEGHKDYKCESCGKSFSEARTLTNHIYTVHEGNKDYKCESCGKSYWSAIFEESHPHSS